MKYTNIKIKVVEGYTGNIKKFEQELEDLFQKGWQREGNISFCKRSEFDAFLHCYQIMILKPSLENM